MKKRLFAMCLTVGLIGTLLSGCDKTTASTESISQASVAESAVEASTVSEAGQEVANLTAVVEVPEEYFLIRKANDVSIALVCEDGTIVKAGDADSAELFQAEAVDDGYILVSAYSDKVLAVPEKDVRGVVLVERADGEPAQVWEFVSTATGSVKLVNKATGRALTLATSGKGALRLVTLDPVSAKEAEALIKAYEAGETKVADGGTDSTVATESDKAEGEGTTTASSGDAEAETAGATSGGTTSGSTQAGAGTSGSSGGGSGSSGGAGGSGSGSSGGSQGAGHTHSWVYHTEQGHYETVVVQEAWDEPVYENVPVYGYGKSVCNKCGEYWSPEHGEYYLSQGDTSHGGYHSEWVITGYEDQIVGYKKHPAVTEQRWVVDRAAYYSCSCGATK